MVMIIQSVSFYTNNCYMNFIPHIDHFSIFFRVFLLLKDYLSYLVYVYVLPRVCFYPIAVASL